MWKTYKYENISIPEICYKYDGNNKTEAHSRSYSEEICQSEDQSCSIISVVREEHYRGEKCLKEDNVLNKDKTQIQ